MSKSLKSQVINAMSDIKLGSITHSDEAFHLYERLNDRLGPLLGVKQGLELRRHLEEDYSIT